MSDTSEKCCNTFDNGDILGYTGDNFPKIKSWRLDSRWGLCFPFCIFLSFLFCTHLLPCVALLTKINNVVNILL